MVYKKTLWKDQNVERPKTYEMTQNEDGSYALIDSFGEVIELGTPVNAANMNNIENGIDGLYDSGIPSYDSTRTYSNQSIVKSFDENNNLKATVNYEEGKRVGPFTVYKKDNAIFCFGSYNDGGRIEKISYRGDRGLYTWNCEGELHCSLKMISDGIIYRFNVNSEGNADGNGEMEGNGQKADVEFENGHIKKSPKCKCYTSYLVTIGLIICGVGICYYLYFKFHVFLFKH